MRNKRLQKSDAVVLLANCKPLAIKLHLQGMNIELTIEDRASLTGFNELLLDNWLEDPNIHLLAKIRQTDIDNLKVIAIQVLTEEIWPQDNTNE